MQSGGHKTNPEISVYLTTHVVRTSDGCKSGNVCDADTGNVCVKLKCILTSDTFIVGNLERLSFQLLAVKWL
jgi:hypothetical protein